MLKKIILISIVLICTMFSISKYALNKQWDITQNRISSISTASQKLIASIDSPLSIDVYTPNISLANYCDILLKRYAKHSKNIRIYLHTGLIEHDIAAKFKLKTEHNLLIKYKNNQQAIDFKLPALSESQVSSLIYKTINSTKRWVVFLTGHQETDQHDNSALGLSQFSKLFIDRGMHVVSLNLAQAQELPTNTDLLVVANPQFELLPIEQTQLAKYLNNGGKMIWFTEPDTPSKQFLKNEFGLQVAPGVAVDPTSIDLGSPHPALKIITEYTKHDITSDIKAPSMLPWSGHLQITHPTQWTIAEFLNSSAHSWTYTGAGSENVEELALHKDIAGPLKIGLALSKKHADIDQRALVIADSTFITNKYIGLYANKQLANSLIGWIETSSHALNFNPPPAQDLSYIPNKLDMFLYRYGFTLLFPLLLICIGFGLQRYNTLAEERK